MSDTAKHETLSSQGQPVPGEESMGTVHHLEPGTAQPQVQQQVAPAPMQARPPRGRAIGLIAAWVLVVIAVGAAATGFMMRSSVAKDLNNTKAQLTAMQKNLTTTQGQLTVTQGQLTTSKGDVTRLTGQTAALNKKTDGCQVALETFVKVATGRLADGRGPLNTYLKGLTDCYGRVPAWAS